MRQLACFEEDQEKRSHQPTALTGEMNRAVYAALRMHGQMGATAEELAGQLYLERVQVGPRLAELWHLGFVRKTEARRRRGIVYIALAER